MVSILDPVKKLECLSFYFHLIYGDGYEIECLRIKQLLTDLVDDYKDKMNFTSEPSSSRVLFLGSEHLMKQMIVRICGKSMRYKHHPKGLVNLKLMFIWKKKGLLWIRKNLAFWHDGVLIRVNILFFQGQLEIYLQCLFIPFPQRVHLVWVIKLLVHNIIDFIHQLQKL